MSDEIAPPIPLKLKARQSLAFLGRK
jgi:hypothetical protein